MLILLRRLEFDFKYIYYQRLSSFITNNYLTIYHEKYTNIEKTA